MISHFSVKNYKCLADVSLPLTKLHVIIGQNDTGKTSLFEAIQAFSWGIDPRRNSSPYEVLNRYRLHHDFDVDTYRTQQSKQPIQFSATLNDGVKNVILSNRVESDHAIPILVHNYKFSPSGMKYPTAVASSTDFQYSEDGFGLATYLDSLQKYSPRKFIALGESFAKYFPQFSELVLKPTSSFIRPPYISSSEGANVGIEVVFMTTKGNLPLRSLSDGAVLLLAFLALTFSPKPPDVILIEEPENGLHPQRLIEVAKLLREFTEREQNAPQIILTTHSPLLLSEFQPEEVTLMRRMEDGSAKAYPLRNAKHIHERMKDKSQLGELWYYLSEDELLL